MLDLVMTWYRRSGQVKSAQVRAGHIRSDQFKVRAG